MRIPRDLSGEELAFLLQRFGYHITRQTGSHMRLTTLQGGEHHIIPIVFVSASAHRPDVNVRAHPAKPFGLFLAPEGGFAD